MEKKKQDQEINKIQEKAYQTVLKTSIENLSQLDQERKQQQKYQNKEYGLELRRQIEDFKDRELKKYNEMSERERQINMKPLQAYENLQPEVPVKQIPGFSKHDEMDRENYRRFNRKGLPSRLLKARGEQGNDGLSSVGEMYRSSPSLPGLNTAREPVRQSVQLY